jgi:phage baseplate assembly protein W
MVLNLNPEEPIELGARGWKALEQAVRLMLFTPKGAVPMRPEFGNALLNRLDEPVDLAQAAQDIADALSQDPRVEVRRVEIDSTALAQGQVAIKLALNFLGKPSELDDITLNADGLIYLINPIVPLPDAEIDTESEAREVPVEFRFFSPCFRELVLEVATDAQMETVVHRSTGETRTRTVNLPRRRIYWWRVRTTDSSAMTTPRKFHMPIDFVFDYETPFVIEANFTYSLKFYLDLTGFEVDGEVWVEVLNDGELLNEGITIEPKARVVKESGVTAFDVVGIQGDVNVVARFRLSGLGIAYEIEVEIQVLG